MFPQQRIIVLVIITGVVVVALGAMVTGNVFLLSLIPVLIVLCSIATRPGLLLAITIAAYASSLKIPSAPHNLTLFHILALGSIGTLSLYRMLDHKASHRKSWTRRYLIGFSAVLLITMYFRGSGIRVLGSSLWGGSMYVILLISIGLFLSQDLVHLSPRAWRNTLIAMTLLSLLPTLAQVLFTASGGAVYQQYRFISATAGSISITGTLRSVQEGVGVARFKTGFSIFLLYLPLLFYAHPLRGRNFIVTFGVAIIALVLSGFSGSRYGIIAMLTFLIVWGSLHGGRLRWQKGIIFVMLLAVLMSTAALFARHFPYPIQRSISFIPFADISQEVKTDADSTITWRLDLWKRAVKDVPKYWLLGRGLTFDSRELMILIRLGFFPRDWAILTGSYHNAILSFLLNLGLAGLIFGFGFIMSAAIMHYRLFKTPWPDPFLARAHRVYLAAFLSHAFLFLTIGGDVQTFAPVIFQAMLLEGLAKTKEAMEESESSIQE